jgi:mono/diheme cytochrome c family protein
MLPDGAHAWSWIARRARRGAVTIVCVLGAFEATPAVLGQTFTPSIELIERGRLLYEAGQLGSGEPLTANRGGDGIAAAGRAAACINCHQKSGFGLFEAANLVPPVTGPSLFANPGPRAQATRRAKGVEHQEFAFLTRPPYDALSLAKALREGVSPSGYRFQYLMPRYALNDADMAALIAYLRQLSAQQSPGIDPTTADFATVIAPNQDAGRRKAVIDVLQSCFRERQPREAGGQAWRLHVWELAGAPDTWGAQLEAKYNAQPVFALISGLGNDTWEPIHRFAQFEKIPSLFPNLDLAPLAEQDAYSFYFSRGLVLEAEVIGQYFLETATASGLNRVVQLDLDGSAGAKAAAALSDVLKSHAIPVEERILRRATSEEIATYLSDLTPSDMLVMWFERSQLAALARVALPRVGEIMVSGWQSGFENAPLPAEWKRMASMVYPIDAPQRRAARFEFNLRPWLKKHTIEHPDEILLGNTLAACNLLSESVSRLRGHFFRDYLVEMIQNYPTGMGNAPASQAFPRFGLGPGQRYSSKGAYIVRFKDPDTNELELLHDWLVPP